ncbi:hypothetical protein HDU86_002551 [Geranomyces michiganensis]|nr:hypothetical protein HDU86_002551 [Geranomyces michiganensis]
MECEIVQRVEVGDHVACFAKVQRIVNTREREIEGGEGLYKELPLLYYRGEYKTLRAREIAKATEAHDVQLHYLRAAWKALTAAAPGADVFSDVRSAIQHSTSEHPYRETHARLVYHLVSVALADERVASARGVKHSFQQFIGRPEHAFLTKMGFANLRDYVYSPAVFCSIQAAESFVPPNKHPLPTSLAECIASASSVKGKHRTQEPSASVTPDAEVPPPRDIAEN